MSRIFLSHSSGNNAEAIALRDWLISHGWDDLFLDLDPERGLKAGERWQAALKQAAERCELVIFLVSPEWAASKWCLAEFLLAKTLNKRIFGVIVEPTPLADVPVEMAAEWQLVDLTAGKRDHKVTVTPPPGDKTAAVAFAEGGLERLRIGLMQAGLDARYFAWPPEDDPDRGPYRGLEPLQAEDAGIFFGRDGPTIVGLDLSRGLREAAPPRLLVILGASGAGKSSFLRAGLLPRLARETQHFLPLPVIRPERAVLSGETGLIVSLETALKEAGIPRTRGDIRKAIEVGPASVAPFLQDLAKANTSTHADDGTKARKPPTLVLAIDQAEELFHGEGAEEARTFLDLLSALAAEDSPALIVLFTIRSESYERLQTAESMQGLRQHTLSLPPMPKGAYAEVIKGPARRLEGTKRALKIEAALVDALLRDIEEGGAKDALPLLAFTLERLYREEGGDGDLKLSEYEELGRIKGSIEAAVERALKAADADPKIPRDRQARLALLRRGLIPWLAGIDPDTGSPRRCIARRSEIPEESVSFIDLLVEQRLLTTDITKDTGEVTIEPVHEALLRQWGLLQGWLADDAGLLSVLEGIKRASRDWAANAKDDAWLAHTAERLKAAELLAERADLAANLGPTDQDYLAASIEHETRLTRKASVQKGVAFSSLAVVGLIAALGGPWAYSAYNKQRLIDHEASRTDIRGQIKAVGSSGMALDTAAGSSTSPFTTPLVVKLRQKDKSLIGALQDVHAEVIELTDGEQTPFLSTSMNGNVYLWRQPQSRSKRAVVVSVDDPGPDRLKLKAPQHDGDAVIAVLRDAGFQDDEIVRLHNVSKEGINNAVREACQKFKARSMSPRSSERKSMSRLTKLVWEGGEQPVLRARVVLIPPEPPPSNTFMIFYFSGHGFRLELRDYLLPTIGISPEDLEAPGLRAAARARSDVALVGLDLGLLEDMISNCSAASVLILDTHFPKISLDELLAMLRPPSNGYFR